MDLGTCMRTLINYKSSVNQRKLIKSELEVYSEVHLSATILGDFVDCAKEIYCCAFLSTSFISRFVQKKFIVLSFQLLHMCFRHF